MTKKLPLFCVLLSIFIYGSLSAEAGTMRAGLAKVVITPPKPIWLSGYAARTHPSVSKYQDIYAKALILADDNGERFVLVSADILGFSAELSESIAEATRLKYGLRRDQLMLNASHTHTGPVIRQNLTGAYQLDAEQATVIYEYAQFLQDRILWVIGQAMRELSPSKISLGHGSATFGVNRREMSPTGMKIGVNQTGVVDHDVPVLRIESNRGGLTGIVFGYACHNTTLTDQFYQISGDYAGFTQANLEQSHPGVVAMYVTGCGADINPFPRGTLELAQKHGQTLADTVEGVLKEKMSSIKGNLRTSFERVTIKFGKAPSREELTSRLTDSNVYKKRHAERMLARLERDSQLRAEYPYPIQILQIGNDLTMVGLGGEVATDYVLRLKRELGANGLWVAGYTNDVMAYIPSARMIGEGGYEVIDSMIYYDLPTLWDTSIEDTIIGKTVEMAHSTGRKK